MNAIKMIHTISRYYNTSGKLTLLFAKVTNQMIANCKQRIAGDPKNDNIWAIPSERLIDSFNDCINLCQKYKSHYEATKKKAAELPKSRHWDFDEAVIFGKFDAFVKRIKKLIELFSTIQQFYTLEKHSNLVGITELLAKFRGILDEFRKKSPNLLDFENIKLEKDYVELMQKIQKLDVDLQAFIDNNFAKLRNISYSLRLLKKFEHILKRDNVRNKLTNKYETILQNFGAEIDTIQKLFDEKKGNPPILRNMPADAGKIIWVRHLFAKLSEPVNEFPPNLINSKEMKKYIDKYNLIGQNLIIYELYFTQSWCNDIDRAKSCLQTTLLVVKEENGIKKLKVNFERDIQKLLREAKALDREGIGGIPESAKIILLQEEKFKRYYFQLDFVRSEYRRITGSIKPIMANLLVPHKEDMDLKLRPGMVTLTWTSMNIDAFIEKVQKGLQRLEQLVHAVNDIIDNRIENNIKMIGGVVLVKLPEDSRALSLEEFVETQQQHIVEQAELLISKNLEIERSVDDLLTCVAQYPLDSNIEDIDMHAIRIVKQYYFWYFYQALLNATQTSLDMMKARICGSRGAAGSSFFEVNLVLEDDEIRMVPSLEDIQKAINRAATAVLSCSKRMVGWGQINGDDSRESYYRIIAQDKEVVKVILLLTGAIQGTKNKIFDYLATFKKYEWLWKDDIAEAIRTFKAKGPELREYEEELRRFTALEAELDAIEKDREISAISIKNENLVGTLKAKCKEWKNNYAEDLHARAKETLMALTENMKNYTTWVSKEVREIDSLGQVMTTLEAIHQEQSEIELRFAPIFDMYGLLDNYLPGGITDKEEMDNRQLLKKKWADIIELADSKQRELQKDQAKNLKKLKENIRMLVQDVKVLRKNFEEEGPMVQGISPKEASDRLKRFENEYELKKAYFEINKKGEDLFGLQNQKYPELEVTHDQIQNLNKLYALYNQVNETTTAWEEEAWSEIQVAQIKDWEDQILKYSDLCNRLPKPLREWQAYKDLKDKIENYKNIFPYVKELKDSMIKSRHWEKIIEVTGRQLNFQQPENFYFRELVEANLINFLEDIEDIIDSAKKQDKIEKTKNEIKFDWNKREFAFKDWGSKRKIQILSGGCIEEIQEKLDEDIATLSGLGAMRHVGPFKEEVQSLQEMLIDIQTTLDLWVKVQILWTSLERVFTEGDISVILTNESKKFAKIDKAWVKTIMEKAAEQKLVKLCCQNEITKSILPGLQEELESCQKQLEKYLEMKRKSFPRFYFVSNQVLLKFLSQGSDPESIQEDFDKLFDAISKVRFDTAHKKNNAKTITDIINVLNSDTEDVRLSAPVVCADFIEKWLQNLEKSMQVTIKDVIRQACLRFLPMNAKELTMPVLRSFINEFPAQVVLIALQLKWTRLVQDALEKKASERNKAVNEAKHEINMILDYLTDMSKLNIEKASDRQKLETLVTIQVYLKEVTSAWRFRDASDFEWQKYTRIYYNTDKDCCNINITDWEAEYSYEYLGVKERLCVTPLTDRCYISLAQAMSMYYGGAPAGPAGTGKTETVKDLGRTLGIFVVVTNCSSEHRYTDMAKIFKGLCQSGLWGCFDEFNRIDLEVLSVVAMQVESITSAKKEKKSEFSFPDETENIHLIPTCGYFITMNPGYAGRQELPENLKVLFRGVTMMVPDREVIIKVKLASCGYKEYAELAKKFKVLYGLCEEQLSKQKHYDFGLRNILSVLRTAGNILREETGVPNEELIMMRTLRDMNLSKLVAEDVPLFNALMRDIFRIENPGKKTYPEVERKIAERVNSAGLELYEPWVLKVIQLYETSLVRHGFMLVGPSCSGKSTIINILTEVLTNLGDGRKYVIQRMNPKAFTSQEMYGVKNFAGEWTPGIFSEMWRKANEKKPNKPTYWLVCDGPVDAIWIENLNTVLDDNKVLTLANGDRIFMLDSVKMVFEVENLNNASPATVSRCGQIYVSPSDLGAEQIMRGWIKQRTKQDVGKDTTSLISIKHTIEKYFNKEDGERVLNLLLKYFRDLNVVENFEKSASKNRVIEIELSLKTLQVLKIFGGLLSGLQGSKNSNKVISSLDYEKLILFSLIWGVAGSYELKERLEFQDLLKGLKDEKVPIPKITDTDTIFDYYLAFDDRGFDWRVIHPETWKAPKKLFFSRLLMPTIDSARAEFLIDTLANAGHYVLLIGGAGTAKTSSILMYANKFDKDKFMLHRINFSSATQPVHFQTSIESVCDTKVRKGFGPKDGKLMTVFIDDLSMPEKNKWGDQITLEIVRELVEDCGFYRLEKNERGNFKFIENLRYIAAMNQPGGGRNDIPNRLKHHFAIFNMILPTRIDIIYDPILKNIFRPNQFSNEVNKVVDNLCSATLRIFNQVKSSLLPTPSKFHYLFNLRDVSRIFRGMCQVKPETINGCAALPSGSLKPDGFLVALWRHECERVFIDKLTNNKDKQMIFGMIRDICVDVFSFVDLDFDKFFGVNYVFCDFLKAPTSEEEALDNAVEPAYECIEDVAALREKSNKLLKKFNEDNPQKQMDLVLFDDALFHLLKISRMIKMPRSSALLVGVGGSGKQSLTRFAARVGGQQLFQIQLTKTYNENNLKEDLKGLFDVAGHKGQPITFILTDAEVKNEEFLEYMNMVLSTGEVPGIIQKDEKEVWLGDVRTDYVKNNKDVKEPTTFEVYDYFLNRLRDNLHVVLCFSPVGNKFRERARKFPALFNECSIDWFLPWPEEALSSVAQNFLANFTQLEAKEEVKAQLPKWMAQVHLKINGICDEYYSKMRRQVFVTPKSYLSFIKAYQSLYTKKFEELDLSESNFKIGLQKIKEAKADIEVLEKSLKEEEEKVRVKKEIVEKIISELNVEREKASAKNEEVSTEKRKIEIEKAKIEKDKELCERELKESLPALEKAQQAAAQVSSKELSDLKPILMQNAHIVMKYVVDAIQVVLYQKVRNDIVMLDKPVYASKKQDKISLIEFFQDSWDLYGKQAFFDPGLAEKLQMMAKTENENLINGEILELLEPYTRCVPTWLSKEYAMNAFNKMGLIHDWMVQIEKFSIETRNIKPKRIALKQAENKLNVAAEKLAEAEKQLEEIQRKCEQLDNVYRVNNDEKNELEEQARKQKKKIDQANRLINSLSEERERWNKGANELAEFKRRLVGNVGLSTAFISYCGPFNAEFRDLIANQRLIAELKAMGIPHSPTIYAELTNFLVDEATVGQWNLDGLPKDVLSIQNGIMVESSERYPLLIDPQNQGTVWIKNKYKDINPETGRPYIFVANINEEKKFRDGLVKCVENGEVLILEGIEGEVDPILDPVLEKQLIKKGRTLKISIGGVVTDFHKKFKLFLTCKLGNPRFSPELSAKTTIIDFTVTQNGLEQQLLSVVLSKKQRILEESLNALMKEVTMNKKELKKLDESLLQKLTSSSGNLLDDVELVEILNSTKTQAKEMQIKLADAEVKTNEINEKRCTFRPVAIRGSVLYFCMIEIAGVNWMYNSSLNQFLSLYNASIDNSPKTTLPAKDVENILRDLTYMVYRYVNRGLFEVDKITFLMMVSFKILITDKKLNSEDVSLFLKAGAAVDKSSMKPKPSAEWISDRTWMNIIAISNHRFASESVPFFKTLPDSITSSMDTWKKWAYERNDPESVNVPEFEERFKTENEIGEFLRLVLVRSIREDRTITACAKFLQTTLGESRYTDPVTDTIESIHGQSSPREPVLFLLSAGADPTSSIDDLARKKKKQIWKVSLGEGQEKKAESLLNDSFEKGDWVLFQNCHLGLGFMAFLDTLISDEEWLSKAHPDFRLWMSCEPRAGFPLGLLQKAIKVTNEPPKGVKAGLFRTFTTIVNPEFLERIDHMNWRTLVYATCFLHSVVQERRKFGPLGWCIPYEYNYSDLEASLAFVEKYLLQLQAQSTTANINQNMNISYPVLIYMICQIQYGGRITDSLDRELFNSYGEMYYRETLLAPDALITRGGPDQKYIVPNALEHKTYLDYIETLPSVDNPELFGLNSNADITFRLKDTSEMIATIMETRPKDTGQSSGKSREEIIQARAKDLLTQVGFDFTEAEAKESIKKLNGPKGLQERGMTVPLNIFLFQEIQRMKRIVTLVKKTFSDIVESIDGQIIMTPEIVLAIDSIFDGKVPSFWIYDPSGVEISWLKPSFSLWFDSLLERCGQLTNWMKNDRPRSFNLGLFFNPQGFLTAMKQEVVRINKSVKTSNKTPVEWSMDNVEYQSSVLSEKQQKEFENGKDLYAEGVYIYGLFLEGCKWSKEGLQDSTEKKMVYGLNVMHVTAVSTNSRKGLDQEKKDSAYNCPVYKYPIRNDKYLIFRVLLPFAGLSGDQNKWKLRGVALLCSTD
jgi:dynein heavy chain